MHRLATVEQWVKFSKAFLRCGCLIDLTLLPIPWPQWPIFLCRHIRSWCKICRRLQHILSPFAFYYDVVVYKDKFYANIAFGFKTLRKVIPEFCKTTKYEFYYLIWIWVILHHMPSLYQNESDNYLVHWYYIVYSTQSDSDKRQYL